uniref:uncharacterized protein LOC100175316 n=1 Tax=Ciona intestinalis TaxID=7719 RepID=UPI000180C888|nr:uncharacterized protein LOC100175316 [Ciona intestinalis]|eukprot:XP_002129808.1 uncharacterized protein LOC100175316 [Ciona intestinalis]
MKITCCCFTCYVGEQENNDPEERRLITEDEEEQSDATHQEPEPVTSPPEKKVSVEKPDQKTEKLHRAVGVLKKYNVLASKTKIADGEKLDERISLSAVVLKVGIKVMARSNQVKIFALDASNVMDVIEVKITAKEEATGSSVREDKPIIQLRTKLIPSDTRGHSKKYEVHESITGSMKFMNECLHSVSVNDFRNCSVRFRLYYVLKHHHDMLLGEYILEIPNVALDFESGTTNVLMELHEPNNENVKPAQICEVHRSLSSVSSSGTGSQSSFASSTSSFKSTIRRGDVKQSTRKGIPSFDERQESDDIFDEGPVSPSSRSLRGIFQSGKKSQGGSSMESIEEAGVQDVQNKSESLNALQKLKRGMLERGEKVSEVEKATEEMEKNASNFSAVSLKLREKYEKKQTKRKHAS